MKAYQIMMFLMLFNLSVSMIAIIPIQGPTEGNITYGIYQPAVAVNNTYNVSRIDAEAGDDGSKVVWRFLGFTVLALIGGAIAGAIVAYLSRVPADSAVAYSIVATEFWAIAYSALAIIWDMGKIPTGSVGDVPVNIGVMMFVYAFTGILAVIWIAWIIQLIRGGFKSMA